MGRDQITFTRTARMRYIGQFHEVEVPILEGEITASTLERAVETLHERHQDLYSFAMPWMPAQFLTFRLLATVARAPFELQRLDKSSSGGGATLKRTRRCLWKGRELETPVYDGDSMSAGAKIAGPAIIEERTTTVVIPEGFTCEVDPFRNYVLRKGSSGDAEKNAGSGKSSVAAKGEA
jgi:N-methylhydantoinase A